MLATAVEVASLLSSTSTDQGHDCSRHMHDCSRRTYTAERCCSTKQLPAALKNIQEIQTVDLGCELSHISFALSHTKTFHGSWLLL